MHSPVDLQLHLALPVLVFQDYRWPLRARVFNTGHVPLMDLELIFHSEAFATNPSAHRDLLRPGEMWTCSLPVTAVGHGLFRLGVSLRLQRMPMMWERFEGEVSPWRVRGNPRTDNNVTFNLSDLPVHLAEKATMGQIVDGGMHLGHNISIDAGRLRDVEAFLDELGTNAPFHEVHVMARPVELTSFENSLEMPMVAVRPGRYFRGSPADEPGRAEDPDQELRHEVILTQPFWMGQFPVTQGQWQRIMGAPGTRHAAMAGSNLPAQGMSWDDTVEFCRKLTRREAEAGTIPQGFAYRLPTEAEWEYACRAGSNASTHGPLEKVAVTLEQAKGIQPVGTMMANAWGFHDMLGNVFEWCHDAFAPYKRALQMDPCNTSQEPDSPRVIRGGCFQTGAEHARAAARLPLPPNRRSGRVGLRVVLAMTVIEPAGRTGSSEPKPQTADQSGDCRSSSRKGKNKRRSKN